MQNISMNYDVFPQKKKKRMTSSSCLGVLLTWWSINITVSKGLGMTRANYVRRISRKTLISNSPSTIFHKLKECEMYENIGQSEMIKPKNKKKSDETRESSSLLPRCSSVLVRERKWYHIICNVSGFYLQPFLWVWSSQQIDLFSIYTIIIPLQETGPFAEKPPYSVFFGQTCLFSFSFLYLYHPLPPNFFIKENIFAFLVVYISFQLSPQLHSSYLLHSIITYPLTSI